MLQHVPQIDQTVKGLGVLLGGQRPFVRFLLRNWPLAVIAGVALVAKGRERYKAGDFTAYNLMADTGMVISPLVGLALLNQLATNDPALAAKPVQAAVSPG